MLTQSHWKRALGVGERVCAGERGLARLRETAPAGGEQGWVHVQHTHPSGFATSPPLWGKGAVRKAWAEGACSSIPGGSQMWCSCCLMCTSAGGWVRDLLQHLVKAPSVVKDSEWEKSRFVSLTEAKRIWEEWETFAWARVQSITVHIKIWIRALIHPSSGRILTVTEAVPPDCQRTKSNPAAACFKYT